MLRFVGRKILNKKWMIAGLLIGNILLMAIAAAGPMYSQAVLQRMLTKNLSASMEETNYYPGQVLLSYNFVKSDNGPKTLDKVAEYEQLSAGMPQAFGLPAVEQVTQYTLTDVQANSQLSEQTGRGEEIKLGFLSGVEDKIDLVAGRLYSDQLGEDGLIEAVVSQRLMENMGLLLGETFDLPELQRPGGGSCQVQVVGVYQPKDPSALFWQGADQNQFVMSESLFRANFAVNDQPVHNLTARWDVFLDYQSMRGGQVPQMLSTLQSYKDSFSQLINVRFVERFSSVLTDYIPQADKLNATLWVLQVPIFVLLAAFIFMVSRQMLEMEQNEIAILKSRGAQRRQILWVYFLQSAMVALASLIVGVPLGMLICQVLGASNAFLEFVQRSALPVEINGMALLFAAAAAVFSIAVMVLPVLQYASVSIVDHKRKKQRKMKAPWWQKIFLDVILLGVSLYGLYSFNSRRDQLALQVARGGSLDPLLFFSASLFMLGAGLLALRLFPLLVRLIFVIGKRWWPPSLYASFQRILHTRGSQGFIMVFLIFTVALGIFNAQAARTINQNGEERIRYANGADVVLQEVWGNNKSQVDSDSTGSLELIYDEPDYERYQQIEGVQSYTKVYYSDDVSMGLDGGGTLNNVILMGVNTKEFGQTAWMKDGLLPVHWYEYLNAISQNARAVLLSSNFQTVHGYQVGDVISYRNEEGASCQGIVYGFVDYWPTYAPTVTQTGSDGSTQTVDQFLIVSNLSQVQAAWGVRPYQVWFNMEGSSQPIYDFAAKEGISFPVFRDTQADIIQMKNDPTFQGTNGVLTVGFIVVLVLCATGFLIYWILSIKSRVLQFGIFRAMGMSMKEILAMLGNEQLFISGVSLAVGAVVGVLSAGLFVPLIQIAYSSADQVIPLEVVGAAGDSLRLFGVIAFVILACMVILGMLISKIKISQALKLGED